MIVVETPLPLLFCYSPILFEGSAWSAVETVLAVTLGLYCSAAFFEGFHLGPLRWFQRIVFAGLAFLLIWPRIELHTIGLLGFILFVFFEKILLKKQIAQSA